MKNKLIGTGIAIITPFTNQGEVDVPSLEKLVDFAIKGGVEYIVALGTTSEAPTLNSDEKALVCQAIGSVNAGRVPMVLGVGGNNTQAVIDALRAEDLSAYDAILSVSPYYNRPSQEGIIAHYTAVADASPLPIIMYNVPLRTGRGMDVSTTLELAEHRNIIGIKEAADNFTQAARIMAQRPEDFMVVTGDDNLAGAITLGGGQGVISVIGQAFVQDFTEMVRAALRKDVDMTNKLYYKLLIVSTLAFKEGNPVGIKTFLYLMGVIESPAVRLPNIKASDALMQEMRTELQTLGISTQ